MAVDIALLKKQLKLHEGWKRFPYTDTVGKITIGCGKNLTDNGLTDSEIDYLVENDIFRALEDLERTLPWFVDLDPVRQAVLADLCFNLGITRLLKFKNTLAAVERGNYTLAAQGMMASKWATQVGKRALRLAQMMETGIFPPEIKCA